MQWSDVPFRPSRRVLRQFAALVLVVFGGAAVWFAAHDEPQRAVVLGIVAAAIGLLGLVLPRAVRPVFVAWMLVAFPIGWTISRILLALIFYGLFTPIGLTFRLLGRDRLARYRRADRTTYWTAKAVPSGRRSYTRPF